MQERYFLLTLLRIQPRQTEHKYVLKNRFMTHPLEIITPWYSFQQVKELTECVPQCTRLYPGISNFGVVHCWPLWCVKFLRATKTVQGLGYMFGAVLYGFISLRITFLVWYSVFSLSRLFAYVAPQCRSLADAANYRKSHLMVPLRRISFKYNLV